MTIDYEKVKADGAKALRDLLNAAEKVIAAEKLLRENPETSSSNCKLKTGKSS